MNPVLKSKNEKKIFQANVTQKQVRAPTLTLVKTFQTKIRRDNEGQLILIK
jgi:hypothetical protein